MSRTSRYLQPVVHKQHFLGLDALRGVVAFITVLYHCNINLYLGFSLPLAHLGVDFFFVLSGFVVACAYDGRMANGMSGGDFALRRLIRLYPTAMVGILLGGVVLANGIVHGAVWSASGGVNGAMILSELALVPVGLAVFLDAYPADTPIWSLVFEAIANYAYATPLGRTGGKRLYGLLGASALVLIGVAFAFHGLASVGHGGPAAFLAGLGRVAFPFLAGMTLWRIKAHAAAPRLPLILIAVVLAGLLALPRSFGWPLEVAYVILLCPAMVWLGSAARIPERLKPACAWLGNWSYPLYVLHVPVIGLVSLLALHTHLGARSQGFLAVTAAVLVAAAFVPLELMVRKALERRLTAPRRPPVLVGPVVPQRFA